MNLQPAIAEEAVALPELGFTAADLVNRDAVAAALGRRLPAGAVEAEAVAALMAALAATPAAGRC